MSGLTRPAVVAIGRGAAGALDDLAGSSLARACDLVAWRSGLHLAPSVAVLVVDGADEACLDGVRQALSACRAAGTAVMFVAYTPPPGEPRPAVGLTRLRKLAVAWDVCVVEVGPGGLADAARAGLENVIGHGLIGYDLGCVSAWLRGPRTAHLVRYGVDRAAPEVIPADARRVIAAARPAILLATLRVPRSIELAEINDLADALVEAVDEDVRFVLGCPHPEDAPEGIEVVVLLVSEVVGSA